jgi:hypothetical protein
MDMNCIKENLKLAKFGEKIVNDMEVDVLFKYSAIACHEEGTSAIFSFISDDNGGKLNMKSNQALINCFKSKLYELEPTSKLIVESDHEAMKTCNTNFINLAPNKMRNEYVNYNAAVSKITCGKVTPNEFTIIFLKGILIDLVELDADVMKSEAKEIKETENTATKHAYDCIMNRFEDEDSNKV